MYLCPLLSTHFTLTLLNVPYDMEKNSELPIVSKLLLNFRKVQGWSITFHTVMASIAFL